MNIYKEMGFDAEPRGMYHEPIRMLCRVFDPKSKPDTDVVVGRFGATRKKLKTQRTYELLVMYGKNSKGDYGLYFRQDQDPKAFIMILDRLQFVFNAETFAKISTTTDCETLKYFISRSIVCDPEEVFKFFKLVNGAISEMKKDVVRTFLSYASIECLS